MIIKWKPILFIIVGIVIFVYLQKIFLEKTYYPNQNENVFYTVNGIDKLVDNTVFAVFLGSSHMEMAVSPLEIYEKYGIETYNLSTSAQTIESSYYLLKKFMKTQKPKYVYLDASVIERQEPNKSFWQMVIDSMPFSQLKLEYATAYANTFAIDGEKNKEIFGLLFPIFQYHDRWISLNKSDFICPNDKMFFGFNMYPCSVGAYVSVDMMNKEQAYLNSIDTDITKKNNKSTDNIQSYLIKIYDLCEANGSKLILTKIPAIDYPQLYDSSWTMDKYNNVKKIADEMQIEYVDLLYDVDSNINWQMDTVDCGHHLNINGAIKVSDFFGQKLNDSCKNCVEHNELYSLMMPKYRDCRKLADLMCEYNYEDYLSKLCDFSNCMVIISGKDDFSTGLTDESKKRLKELGIISDLSSNVIRKSFIAVLDDGKSIYEEISYNKIAKKINCDGHDITIISAGFNASSASSIIVDSVEYSDNQRGLNIVVIDKYDYRVIDSLTIDFAVTTCSISRNNPKILGLFKEYENKKMVIK